ncbi:MAG: hypothetical protein M3Y55_11050, partial [Pseudomonadota bacterium]|nr:hypothetical protein [Pseudomonadota bacterium]
MPAAHPPILSGLKCVRCGKAFTACAYARCCDACEREGVAANLTVVYPERPTITRVDLPSMPRSMWRFDALLHTKAEDAV